MHSTTIVLSYNEIDGFEPGSYGNGRVVIIQADKQNFSESDCQARLSLWFQTLELMCRHIDAVYVYMGDFDSEDDVRFKIFRAMYTLALSHVKNDKSKVHYVGCRCGINNKRHFAEIEGINFIESECGGRTTLSSIVKEILATVPKEAVPTKHWKLGEDFVAQSAEDSNCIKEFAAINQTLFAGRSDGQIFVRKDDGVWLPISLKLEQGVNLMIPDGNNLLIGDGSCCSGSTFRLHADLSFEQILPVEGQGQKNGDINCNVYGFARYGDELLTGGGGCCGEHVYTLNSFGKWQYHKNDPKLYVTRIQSTSNGTFLALRLRNQMISIRQYDGQDFIEIGQVKGWVYGFFEFHGKIYIGSILSGPMYPTSRSVAFINVIEDGEVRKVYSGVGGVNGFFVVDEKLYAFGTNHVDHSTLVLMKKNDETWELTAKFDQRLGFFVHDGVLYAGGCKTLGNKDHAAVIYKVN